MIERSFEELSIIISFSLFVSFTPFEASIVKRDSFKYRRVVVIFNRIIFPQTNKTNSIYLLIVAKESSRTY